MTREKIDRLRALLRPWPATLAICEAVLAVWPHHARYLVKSFETRAAPVLAATEAAAEAALCLMAGDKARFAADYRWTCDRFIEEELFFRREERYQMTTFSQAVDKIYSNENYMRRYVNGLLISHILWFNHAAIFEMFINRVLGVFEEAFDYLEVGPGHGLMIYLAARSPFSRSLEAWDVSAISLQETRAALDRLDTPKPVTLNEVDILKAGPTGRRFGLIVISEVLEHLEDPGAALRVLRRVIAPEGRLFVDVPLNSPAPDHIYLLSSPEEVRDLVESAGFRVDRLELHATQGINLDRALSNRISVSAGVIAVPVGR